MEIHAMLGGTARASVPTEALMPDDLPSARLQGLLQEIWLYLSTNPRGKDTVEGIQEWWIPDGKQRFSKSEVQNALDFIVARGGMQQSIAGTTVLYSIAQTSFKEFKKAMDELE
jgi:hypothetical protein